MASSAETPEEVPVAQVCRACRFGRGSDRECVLLDRGDETRLFEEGPCDLSERIRTSSLSLIRRRYPFARTQEEDVASEVLLRIMAAKRLLVPGVIRHLPVLERRLADVVRNAVIDVLRHHKLITKIRCGACVHFGREPPPPSCHLDTLPPLGTEAAPNPWYMGVERTTNPHELEPRCDVFEWRRPETHDIFEDEVPGLDPEGSPRERAAHVLVQAIDRMSRGDRMEARAAAALFWHYLRGRDVKEIAKDAGVSDKTVKRLLAAGRERLLEVLTDEFGVTEPGDVL